MFMPSAIKVQNVQPESEVRGGKGGKRIEKTIGLHNASIKNGKSSAGLFSLIPLGLPNPYVGPIVLPCIVDQVGNDFQRETLKNPYTQSMYNLF